MILILTFIYRLRAYAQCREHELCLRLPLSQLVIPYTEIRTTRPTELHHMFPPEKQRWTQRNFLGPLLGRTVVVVEMERMPLPPSQLRRRTGKYMVSPDGLGIVVPVRDWMRFRTELDEAIARSQRTSKLAIS
jgi:extradiol dioxygenase family protein